MTEQHRNDYALQAHALLVKAQEAGVLQEERHIMMQAALVNSVLACAVEVRAMGEAVNSARDALSRITFVDWHAKRS